MSGPVTPACVRCGHNQLGQQARVLDLGCDRDHDEVVRACEQCAWRMLREQPNLPCPLCAREGFTAQASVAIYCGMCRKGQHTDCRAMRAGIRIFAGLDPWNSEGYCACTCDLDDPMLPGAGYARHPSEAKLDALEQRLRQAFEADRLKNRTPRLAEVRRQRAEGGAVQDPLGDQP